MSVEQLSYSLPERELIRVDTLIRLRWYAIIGQAGAVGVIAFGFGYPMAWEICLALICLSSVFNIILARTYKTTHRLPGAGAFRLLAFDIVQLGVLLFLTGGLQNPFAMLLLAPVVVSSTSLGRRHILLLGLLAISVITLLALYHLPLPWNPNDPLKIPSLFIAGVWVAIVCTLGFTAIYAYRVAQEARKLADALSATELILQREQHLTALDGLAAAAAHELGTPLATIALVSKEMVNTLPKDDPLAEDARLLRSQADRCRDILQKLASLNSDDEEIIQNQTIVAMLDEEIVPLRDFGIDIQVHQTGRQEDIPVVTRNPGIHYGIGNLIDNAVNFAKSGVVLVVHWDEDTVRLEISDDGPGFPASVLDKFGEPFISQEQGKGVEKRGGLGLGLFISKTLLERSGGVVSIANKKQVVPHLPGAFVEVIWARAALDRNAVTKNN